MNTIIYLFITGYVYFFGMWILALALLFRYKQLGRLHHWLTFIPAFIGAILVFLSGQLLSGPWIVTLSLPAILGQYFLYRRFEASRLAAGFSMVVSVLIFQEYALASLMASDAPPLRPDQEIYVLGDSLSIGADDGRDWPRLLGERLERPVHNFGFGGARVETQLPNAKLIPQEDAYVIIELGGNNVLYRTPNFAVGLDTLLKEVGSRSEHVVMFDLPVPPLHDLYTRTIHHTCAKYNVHLLSRRILADVITTPDATTDGLHLSTLGHEMLAEAIALQLKAHTGF